MTETKIRLKKENKEATIILSYTDPFTLEKIGSRGDTNLSSVFFFYGDEPRGYFTGEKDIGSAEWWINNAHFVRKTHGIEIEIENPPVFEGTPGEEGVVY
jgi:hypothetical protein